MAVKRWWFWGAISTLLAGTTAHAQIWTLRVYSGTIERELRARALYASTSQPIYFALRPSAGDGRIVFRLQGEAESSFQAGPLDFGEERVSSAWSAGIGTRIATSVGLSGEVSVNWPGDVAFAPNQSSDPKVLVSLGFRK